MWSHDGVVCHEGFYYTANFAQYITELLLNVQFNMVNNCLAPQKWPKRYQNHMRYGHYICYGHYT